MRKYIPPAQLGNLPDANLMLSDAPANTLWRTAVKMDRNEIARAFVTIATHAWKAKVRLARPDTSLGSDGERVARHVDAIVESLEELGIEIKDHTGELFDYGQSLKVVASQPKEGISRDVVAETIRPTIYLKGALIQQGEVVIDIPSAKEKE